MEASGMLGGVTFLDVLYYDMIREHETNLKCPLYHSHAYLWEKIHLLLLQYASITIARFWQLVQQMG